MRPGLNDNVTVAEMLSDAEISSMMKETASSSVDSDQVDG